MRQVAGLRAQVAGGAGVRGVSAASEAEFPYHFVGQRVLASDQGGIAITGPLLQRREHMLCSHWVHLIRIWAIEEIVVDDDESHLRDVPLKGCGRQHPLVYGD